MAKITIFGLAGTGTSTTGKALAHKLGYSFMSSGNMAREKAKEMGISIYELGELGKTDPKYDKVLDEKIEGFGKENENFVVESWLAWHFIPDSIKIKLHCDLDIRVGRVAHRDGVPFEEGKKLTLSREKSNASRFAMYYGIEDFSADTHFDLILDTSSTPVAEIVAKIEAFVKQKVGA